MAKVSTSKLKTLYIMEALTKQTDDNNKLSARDLIEMLNSKGIKAERKSIYDDIETLREFGMDIIYDKTEPAGYFLADRDFELPELKLLVDAVQASQFITVKKSSELIKKIEGLASEKAARQLQRQVVVSNRAKAMNESIYYNVDAIHSAIQANSRIKFEYLKWNMEKKLVSKHEDNIVSSPWALIWDNANYYMLGYDSKSGIIKHYRVDKMMHIRSVDEEREGRKVFEEFDMAKFATKTFSMFGGKSERVVLECDNSLIGAIFDRFGTDSVIVPVDEDRFQIAQDINISGQFYGWVVGLGPGVKIKYPGHVVEEFRQRLDAMREEL